MFGNQIEVIDAHCHIYPEKIAARAALSVGDFYGESAACPGTVEGLLREGSAAGIDRFVVQSVATTPHQVESINRFIASEVAEQGGRLIGFGTLHPDSADQAGGIARLRELGLRGVKLHPDIQGFKIDDYRCLRIYELCEQEGLPILMHTGDSRYDNSNPNRLLPILKIYTGLTVIGAHFGGWSIWEEASEQLCGIPNLYVDCSSSLSYIPAETARKIIRRYGADRVLFGTDYPLHSPVHELELFGALGLTDEENRAILNGNARRLLGL